MPAKLAVRVRVFDTGHGRKTDATDAHSIVMAALRTRGLRTLVVDEDLAVLRLLADRRDELSRTRVQTLNRLHRLLAELIPGGASRLLYRLAGQGPARFGSASGHRARRPGGSWPASCSARSGRRRQARASPGGCGKR